MISTQNKKSWTTNLQSALEPSKYLPWFIIWLVHYRKHLCHAMLWLDHNSFFVHISFLLALPYTLSSLSPLFKPLFFWLAAPKLEKQRAVRQSEMNFLQRNVELKCPKSSPIFTSLNHCGNLCRTHKLETVMFKV